MHVFPAKHQKRMNKLNNDLSCKTTATVSDYRRDNNTIILYQFVALYFFMHLLSSIWEELIIKLCKMSEKGQKTMFYSEFIGFFFQFNDQRRCRYENWELNKQGIKPFFPSLPFPKLNASSPILKRLQFSLLLTFKSYNTRMLIGESRYDCR